MPHAAINDATPTKTPSSENPLFSFWARIVWNAMRMASKNGTQAARSWSVATPPSGSGMTRSGSAAQRDAPLGVRGDVLLVRRHRHRLALVVQLGEHAHDLGAGRRVEVSRRLVGGQERRVGFGARGGAGVAGAAAPL